jgi:ADP-ribosyl-[dinitrogen reductase] hydrolase
MDEDRIKGMLWGAALGDALGAPHEFRYGTPLRYYSGILKFPVVRQNKWQGRRVGVIGQLTDDTEMMLTLARSLLVEQKYVKKHAIAGYLAWANSKAPFMGFNTRKLFHGIKTLRGYDSRYKKRFCEDDSQYWSQSNGCLMRCAPLAVLGVAGVEAAVIDCALTNPHPVCIDSCRVYVKALVELGKGTFPEDVVARAEGWAKHPIVVGVLREACGDARRNITDAKGWVLHALWAAFRALKLYSIGGTYEDSVDWVVRLGGDTDTNASIAGGLIGTSLGYIAMESEERTGSNMRIALGANPSKGAFNRPDIYRVARINYLAGRLAKLTK